MQNNIESLFVPYEQALALKELGFDEPCLGYWRNENLPNPITIGQYTTKEDMEYEISGQDEYHNFENIIALAPLYQQAFRFFRSKYGLMHIINPYDFTAEINYLNKRVVDDVYGDFIPHDHLVDDKGEEIKHLSYEEAEIACLLELINICKKK